MSKMVRYDDALTEACAVVRSHRDQLGERYLLLRDLYGYLALVVDRQATPALEPLREELHRALGGFSPGSDGVVLGRGDLGSIDDLLDDPDAMPADDKDPVVRLVERQLTGNDWWRGAPPDLADPPRLVFYGIKGGVGRSTALAIAAWHLAQRGKRVLVVDLDLESPGVSSMLLPHERAPRYGVVDWLVESGVGQGDAALMDEILAPSPLAADSAGEIWIASAGGQHIQSYVSKLARAYLTVSAPDGTELPFAARLDAMVRGLVEQKPSDVVLLDSRAGMHDISAAAIRHLGAQTLLFATDNEQTFWGYDALFHELCRAPAQARALRERLKLVSALAPSPGRPDYLNSLRDRAYRLFQDHFYEPVGAGEVGEFNYDREDPDAPHDPLSVFWAPQFSGDFSPATTSLSGLVPHVQAAFGDFLRGIEALVSEASQ